MRSPPNPTGFQGIPRPFSGNSGATFARSACASITFALGPVAHPQKATKGGAGPMVAKSMEFPGISEWVSLVFF